MAMKLSFLSALWNSDRGRRLTIGLAASVTMHVLIMLIPFAISEMASARAPSLDVILVNARHDTAPKDAQALAQANLDGGGDNSENIRATSPLLPQESMHDGNELFNMTRGQPSAIRQQQREQILTQSGSSVAIDRPKPPEDKPSAPQPVTGSDAMDSVAMALKLRAEIAEKTIIYNQRPRRRQIGARTQEYRFAQYIETWRIKAERIGEKYYPQEARGKIYDSLLMTVSIKKDGSIEKVVIHRRSKHAVLNEAAERIVRMGEPYAPFPPEIARDTDVLDITRTWMFTNNKLGVTAR